MAKRKAKPGKGKGKARRETAAVKAERKRQRSEAARRGWETRRAGSFAKLANTLLEFFKSDDWREMAPARAGKIGKDPREVIRNRLRRKQRRMRVIPPGEMRARWDTWVDDARSIQPGVIVHVDPAAMDHDPTDARDMMYFQVLTAYVSTKSSGAYAQWLASGEATEAYEYWAKTGRLPPSAQYSGARFDTKTYRRSANLMLSGVFAVDFVSVEAVRVMPRNQQSETVQLTYVRKATRWTQESRAAFLNQQKRKDKQK